MSTGLVRLIFGSVELRIRGSNRYDDLPNLFLELGAREHHAPAARQTVYADVGTDAGHLPFVPSAWVRLAHAHPITDAYFEWSVTQ